MKHKKKYIGNISMRDMGRYYKYGLLKIKKSGRYIDIINREIDYVFDEFYKNEIIVKVEVTIDNKLIFEKVGILYKAKKFGMYEWYLQKECLGDILFDNVGKMASLVIRY